MVDNFSTQLSISATSGVINSNFQQQIDENKNLRFEFDSRKTFSKKNKEQKQLEKQRDGTKEKLRAQERYTRHDCVVQPPPPPPPHST